MDKILQQDINCIVWKACEKIRVTGISQYKDYVLILLFIKYVSDIYKYNENLKRYERYEEYANKNMRRECFDVPKESSFDYLYEHRNDNNIGELINIALANLEKANREKIISEDGSGVFCNIDFNSNNLGDTTDKNTLLKNLLIDFSDEKLNFDPEYLYNNDVISDAYMYLVSTFVSDAGKKADNFFTPAEVSSLLAKLTKSRPGARICDPACGSGSLLIKAGQEVGGNNFSLYGQELNVGTWALAMMNMFLHGFGNATIRWGDTLKSPKLLEGDKLMKFDTVVAVPPFSLNKWGADEAERDMYSRFWRGVPPKSKGDWAFISHMIEVAYEGRGKVGVVVPHGVLFRGSGEGKIRQKTIEENLLEAVIGLPANLFFGTGIPVAIVIFNKGKKTEDILFIDASREYEAGKNQNKLRSQNIEHIVSTYREFTEGKLKAGIIEDKYAYVATPAEIEENDYNLSIPRYVNVFKEKDEVDIKAVQQEIDRLERELAGVQAKMKESLKELGYE